MTALEARLAEAGDLVVVEGRMAMYVSGRRGARGRWQWANGDWTAIPMGPVEHVSSLAEVAAHDEQAARQAAQDRAAVERVEAVAVEWERVAEANRGLGLAHWATWQYRATEVRAALAPTAPQTADEGDRP